MAKLNARQQRFVKEYLIDPNATQAAIKAGYSKKDGRRHRGGEPQKTSDRGRHRRC
jgi:phage terminase small subunit